MPKKYKLCDNLGTIQATDTMAFIPDDPSNADWREYQAWLSEGNTPDPWKTPLQLSDEATEAAAEIARKAAKAQSIIDNLPSWSQVKNNINSISGLADVKAVLLKLARVIYWDVKNEAD